MPSVEKTSCFLNGVNHYVLLSCWVCVKAQTLPTKKKKKSRCFWSFVLSCCRSIGERKGREKNRCGCYRFSAGSGAFFFSNESSLKVLTRPVRGKPTPPPPPPRSRGQSVRLRDATGIFRETLSERRSSHPTLFTPPTAISTTICNIQCPALRWRTEPWLGGFTRRRRRKSGKKERWGEQERERENDDTLPCVCPHL